MGDDFLVSEVTQIYLIDDLKGMVMNNIRSKLGSAFVEPIGSLEGIYICPSMEKRFYDDAGSEYDSRFLYIELKKRFPNMSEELKEYLHYWDLDEADHYYGFAQLYAACVQNKNKESLRLELDNQMKQRVADFSKISQFLVDEFSVCLLLAYDELMNTYAYKEEFPVYDELGSPAISKWIRRVAQDEARHYIGAIKLLLSQHADRLNEAQVLLEEIVRVDTSGKPYQATFVLDRADDDLNEARDLCHGAASRVLSRLNKGMFNL